MADSLDDFFAKKDKKRKNKSQTAALSAGALVKELEEGAKQSEYSARREGKTSAAMELLGLNANDNDWKDFEEVEKRDYTGLKVKEMSIQDQDDEQRRLTEQSEQVPETVPWKSKQDTVAAIISTKNELNPLASALAEQDEPANGTTPDATTATPTNTATALTSSTTATTTTPLTAAAAVAAAKTATTDPKSSNIDNTDSEANKAATAKESTDEKAAVQSGVTEQKDAAAAVTPASDSNAKASKKDGDTQPAAPKKVYVPPGSRMDNEVNQLEPIRLGKTRLAGASSRRGGAHINLESKMEFPSLG